MERRGTPVGSAGMLVGLSVSLLAQVCGFISAVIMIYVFLAPQYQLSEETWKRTLCYIENISRQDIPVARYYHGTQAPSLLNAEKLHSHPTTDQDELVNTTLLSTNCAVVHVIYKRTENTGSWNRATLHLSKSEAATYMFPPLQQSIAETQCFCTGCAVTTTFTNESATLILPAHLSPEVTLQSGDAMNCYLSVSYPVKRHIWKSLFVISIPTTIFILGFVGTFLFTVKWQKIEEDNRQSPNGEESCEELDDIL